MLTSIVAGKAAYNPPYEKIKAKYFEKFRGKGGDGGGTAMCAGHVHGGAGATSTAWGHAASKGSKGE